MRLCYINENDRRPVLHHREVLGSLFTDKPLSSLALEPNENGIEELEDDLGDELDKSYFGRSSNFHRLNTFGNDDIRGSQK